MSDRLKAIWGGFENRTSRELSGRGVDKIIVPRRENERRDYAPLAEDANLAEDLAPAKAAMSELRTRLAASAAERSKSKRMRRSEPAEAAFDAADLQDLEADFGAGDPTAELRAGLASTERRVRRRELSYTEHRTKFAQSELSRKRKKFLGLF